MAAAAEKELGFGEEWLRRENRRNRCLIPFCEDDDERERESERGGMSCSAMEYPNLPAKRMIL